MSGTMKATYAAGRPWFPVLRLLILAAVLLSSVSITRPAWSDELARNIQIARSCADQVVNGAREKQSCVGVVYDACVAVEGDTTAGMNICLRASIAAWDAILNQSYQQQMQAWQADGDTRRPELLRDAQRGWIRFRDNLCEIESVTYEGGTFAAIAYGNCYNDLVALRAVDLHVRVNSDPF